MEGRTEEISVRQVSIESSYLPGMYMCSSKTIYMKQLHNFNFTMFLFTSIYFLLIIPDATSLNFSYPRFLPEDNVNLRFERDASLSSQSDPVIRLTRDRNGKPMNVSCGRMKYAQKMQLWDKTSGKLTDFTTNFSFVIISESWPYYGDGFAFFLSPNDSLPENTTKGGSMCLTLDDQPFNSTTYPFVAVEFDIFSNYVNWNVSDNWDRINREHVGVDINSMKSVADETWEGVNATIRNGNLMRASINYNSSSLNLSVAFTSNTTIEQHLSYIVDLRRHLPEEVTFGFSAATGAASASFEIHSWDFRSTFEIQENTQGPIAEEPIAANPVPAHSVSRSHNNAINAGLAVGLSIGAFGLILVLGLISLGLWKKWKKNNEEEDQEFDEYVEDDFAGGTGPQKYSYAELASAANNFKEEQKLGQGGFGGVYKGFLKDSNCYVAIKRISEDSRQGIKEFASEIRIISQLRHRNLVQLVGWCHERKQLLLVYEYMPNGSLDLHLFTDQSLLTWEVRYKIAQGLASALLYLHEGCEQCVVHRDIKSSNIMLDSNFNTKLGDFGLARLVDHAKDSQITYLVGTLGYMTPEYNATWRYGKETDVYSFGIVALEIACGRKPIKSQGPQNEINIVEWVWELYGNGRILEASDPRLSGFFQQHQMKCLMIVGLWCAHPDRYNRPTIKQAIQVLNFEAPLPNLPSSLPVQTCNACPMRSSAFQYDNNDSMVGHDQNPSSSLTYYRNYTGITTSS